MNQLIIEASGPQLGLLLSSESGVTGSVSPADGRHDQRLLPDIKALMGQAGLRLRDVDRIGVGIGPGSFTGIRVALASAQGMAMAQGLPLYPLDSLALLALSHGPGCWHIVMDARLGEVYQGQYQVQQGQVETLLAPELIRLEQLQLDPEFAPLGDGWALASVPAQDLALSPSADWLGLLERTTPQDPEHCEPAYLRNTVSWKKLSEQPSPLSK